MGWTLPRDWTNGEVVTDTMLDTHIRDNLTYLKGAAGAVVIDHMLTAGAMLGSAQIAVQEISANGQSTFLMSGEPGVTYDAGLLGFNWKQTAGSSLGRHNIAKGASYLRMLPNEIDFDVVSAAGVDTRMMYLTATGLGLKRSSPQGLLHGYNTISGFLFWEYDGVDGTTRTIIPDGVGDCLYGADWASVVRSSSGTTQRNTGSLLGGGGVGTSDLSDIYTDGTNVLRLRVTSAGVIEIFRNAGTATFKVALRLLWL